MMATATNSLDLGDLTIRHISVSSMDNNVYLMTCRNTGTQLLIDAADDPDAISGLVAAGQHDVRSSCTSCGNVQLIVTTHSHWDHVRALAEIKSRSEALTACGAADEADINVPMDFTFEDGDTADLDGFSLDVIGLRGHTPGSIALAYTPEEGPVHIFTGDSLFPGGVGKTGSDAAFRQLLSDVTTRIFDVYDDDTVILPGHGASTTLGAERPHLEEWRERGW
jgi:glyoxylase-like metal-dependent hydrolase (beta-lactamase superfamily II)